jgi:chromosome transmission fidelity protein 4
MASFWNPLGASRPLIHQIFAHLKNALQATCGCDGKIIIWDVSGAEPRLTKTIEDIIPTVVDTQWAHLNAPM